MNKPVSLNRSGDLKKSQLTCRGLLGGLVLSAFGLAFSSSVVHAENLVIGGTGWPIGIARQLANVYMKDHPEVQIEVPDSVGSSGGIKAVLAGRFDFSFAARPIKKKNQGKGLRETPFVVSPFVLAVSPVAGSNPALTKQQVVSAFAGDLKAWPNGVRLGQVLRRKLDTDTRMLIEYFDGIEPILDKRRLDRGALTASTDQEAMDIAETVPGTLVATILLALRAENRKLVPIAIDGVQPTTDALQSGKWDMGITLYIIEGAKLSPQAQAFKTYMLSDHTASFLRSLDGIPLAK